MTIITCLDDIKLIDTPVRYLSWTKEGRVEQVRHEQRAQLFKAEGRAGARPATVVLSNAYGDPFVAIGRLTSVEVSPQAINHSSWVLRVGIIPPKERNAIYFPRGFPEEAMLLMWGVHDISLAGLPPHTAPIRWHCTNFATTWQQVARRCHATEQVWLDTVAVTIEHHKQRREERNSRG
jgi:hypothetical protein